MPVVADIVGRLGVQGGGALLERVGNRRHGGELLVVDGDQLGGVLGFRPAVGDDHRYRVADMPHLVDGQHRVRRLFHRRIIFEFDTPAAGQAADIVGREVLADKDGHDSRCCLRPGGVDLLQAGMRVGRPEDMGVELARAVDVVDIGPATGEEAEILLALDGRTDAIGHDSLPGSCLLAHCGSAGLDRLDDVVIAGAAAEIALEIFSDLLLARAGVGLHQVERRHHHPRRAETALQAVVFAEGVLHRVQGAVGLGDALDGQHLGALALHGEDGAALDRLAVDVHDAGAALAGVAADMRAGQSQFLAQQLHEQGAALDLGRGLLAVHGQRYLRHV